MSVPTADAGPHPKRLNGDVRILFTASPLVGHVFPMLPLMHAARDAGHEVVLATGAEMIPDVRSRRFTTWTVGPGIGEALADLGRASAEPAAGHEEQLGRDAIHLFARPSVRRALDLLPRAAAWGPDIVVSEITELAGREVACATGALPVTHGFGTHVPDSLALAAVMFEHVSSELGTPNRRHAFETGIYVDPCPPGLQSAQFPDMDIRPVRPSAGLVSPQDRLPRQFLELPSRPLVYVTLGTVFNDPELTRSLLDALQDLPISIAITTGPGSDPSILGARPANVAAAPFVSQALVMPLASAVVSHAGSGTMLGALASGLPQVCLPRGADQFANADRVQSVGAGVRLLPDEVTPERLRAAVTALLDDPAYTRAATAMKTEIAAMPSAADVLDDLVGLASGRRIA
jgi:UDP:flavonoid glycosyltransferase YjiC (YdhE family)